MPEIHTTPTSPFEEWKVTERFPKYEVSTYGRLRRITPSRGTRAGKLLKTPIGDKGYPIAVFSIKHENGWKSKTCHVHILVAEAFLPPRPTPKHEVNHKDLVKANNLFTNLEWTTHAENMQHATRNGHTNKLYGEGINTHKLTVENVKEIRRLFRVGGITNKVVASMFDVYPSTISNVRTGLTWKSVM